MPFARHWLSSGHSSVYQASSLFYIYIICCTSADRVLNSRTRALKNEMASHPYIYIVCVRRANSELLRWSRHFNDVSFFVLLEISVTGLKILGVTNVHDLVLNRLKKFEYNQNNNKINVQKNRHWASKVLRNEMKKSIIMSLIC